MVIQIQQTWWHIEEIYSPTIGRKIKQVMDLFTDQSEIPIGELENCSFVGLKVIARNGNGKEIPFLEREEDGKYSIILNLNPLSQFPDVPRAFTSESGLKHIKIEIEYILTDIALYECPFWDRHNIFAQEKNSSQEIYGSIQPEFYFTLPQGWIVSGKNDGEAIKVDCIIKRAPNESDSGKITLAPTQDNAPITLILDQPFIKISDHKRVYNYLITDRSFKDLQSKIRNNDSLNFILSYKSRLCNEIVGISLFRYVLGILAGVLLLITALHYFGFTEFFFDCNFGIAFLIVLMGYAYYYGNLVYQGYDIPNRDHFIWIFGLCIFAILVVLIMPAVSPDFIIHATNKTITK